MKTRFDMQHAQQQSTWPLHELGRACRCMPRRERDSRLCGAVCAVCHLSQVSMLPCPQPTEPRHPCISAPFHAFRLSIVKVSIINPPRRSNFKGSSCEEQGPWNMSLTCRRREPTALSSIAASTSCFGRLTCTTNNAPDSSQLWSSCFAIRLCNARRHVRSSGPLFGHAASA